MPITVKNFAIPAAAGDVVVAHGLAEAPKALIFFTVLSDAAGSWRSNAYEMVGFWTPGDGAKSVAAFGVNGLLGSNEVHARYASILWPDLTNGGAEFTISSADATNFTAHFAGAPFSGDVGKRVGVIAIAGPSVQAKIVQHVMRTTTGLRAVTGVGFKPDLVFFAHAGDQDTTEDTSLADARIGFGWMCGDGTQAHIEYTALDGQVTTAAGRRFSGTGCVVACDKTGGQLAAGVFSSMDTDGYTLNYSVAAGVAAPVYSLCIKGVKASSLQISKKNGTGTQAVTGFTTPFPPQLAVMVGFTGAAGGTGVVNASMSLGAAAVAGAGQGFATTNQARNGQATSIDRSYSNAKAYACCVPGVTQSIAGEADISSFDATGLTLNWTTSDTSTNPIQLLIVRVPDWGGVLSDLATAADAITRAEAAVRSMANTAGATDALTRQQTASRGSTESAPGSDTVARVVAYPRAPTDAATAADALVRATADARSVADAAPASETLARAANNGRPIADSAPSSDAIARGVGEGRSVADSAPATDSVTRAAQDVRTPADTAAASDTLSGAASTFARSVADSAPATDAVASPAARPRALDDSAPASGVLSRATQAGRDVSDSAPSSDSTQTARTAARALSEAAPAAPALVRAFGGSRALANAAPAADALSRRIAYAREFLEAVAGSDAVASVAVHHVTRLLAEAAFAADSLGAEHALLRVLADFAPASDQLRGFVPVGYIPEPTDAALIPSLSDADLIASRDDLVLAASIAAAEFADSADDAELVASRTDFEVVR